MNKVEKVSIGGYAFTLDERAYEVASAYLDELKSFYGKQMGGSEIMEGIEERMAELLLEKCGPDTVASEQDINAIIAILGRPEVIEESDGGAQAEEKPAKKKLYRDLSNRVLGGVCSGLSTYFNIDVVLIRLAFALLTLLSCFSRNGFVISIPVIYLILWIAMPAARTVRQKLESKGESGTVDEISKKFADGTREVVEEVRTAPLWKKFGRILGVIIGIVFLVGGTSGLSAGAIMAFKFPAGSLAASTLIQRLFDYIPSEYVNLFSDPVVVTLVILCAVLPLLLLLYEGLKLIFNFKAPKWHPGLVIFVLWLIALVVLGVLLATGGYSTFLGLEQTLNV